MNDNELWYKHEFKCKVNYKIKEAWDCRNNINEVIYHLASLPMAIDRCYDARVHIYINDLIHYIYSRKDYDIVQSIKNDMINYYIDNISLYKDRF